MTNLNELYEAILGGKLEQAQAVTQQAIAEGIEPQSIINDYMVKGMEEIGVRFEAGKAFVPNLLMSARAMKGCLELLKPLLKGDSSTSAGRVVIGTVKGDLHDIGKNLVASMLEGCGFEVINLGVDVSSDTAVKASGLRDQVKVMVGGAPLNNDFAVAIGADGYSSNANDAVALARRLVNA